MRWRGERESSNVEDRRGISTGKVAIGGGLGTLIIVILALLLGADPQQILQQVPQNNPSAPVQSSRPNNQQEDEMKKFVSVVLGKTEDVWTDVFRKNGRQYREPTLVLFTDQVQSACGISGAAVGPFYCPGDQKVYIDLSFYEELRRRFNAPGDFAQAYVIAHEVGHHVQKLLGISDKVDAMQRRMRSRFFQLRVGSVDRLDGTNHGRSLFLNRNGCSTVGGSTESLAYKAAMLQD